MKPDAAALIRRAIAEGRIDELATLAQNELARADYAEGLLKDAEKLFGDLRMERVRFQAHDRDELADRIRSFLIN